MGQELRIKIFDITEAVTSKNFKYPSKYLNRFEDTCEAKTVECRTSSFRSNFNETPFFKSHHNKPTNCEVSLKPAGRGQNFGQNFNSPAHVKSFPTVDNSMNVHQRPTTQKSFRPAAFSGNFTRSIESCSKFPQVSTHRIPPSDNKTRFNPSKNTAINLQISGNSLNLIGNQKVYVNVNENRSSHSENTQENVWTFGEKTKVDMNFVENSFNFQFGNANFTKGKVTKTNESLVEKDLIDFDTVIENPTESFLKETPVEQEKKGIFSKILSIGDKKAKEFVVTWPKPTLWSSSCSDLQPSDSSIASAEISFDDEECLLKAGSESGEEFDGK